MEAKPYFTSENGTVTSRKILDVSALPTVPVRNSESHKMDMEQTLGLMIFAPILIVGSFPLALTILLRTGETLFALMRPGIEWQVGESDSSTKGDVAQLRNAEERVLEA